MPESITEALIDILQRQRANGRTSAYLSEEAKAHLLQAAIGMPPRSPAPQVPARQPAARPRTPITRPEPATVAEAPAPVQGPPPAQLDWDALEKRVNSCQLCTLCRQRRQAVFGVGSRNADLMFIGEAPGRDEDEQGEPFVGAAGHLLTRMIQAMQFSRDQVYIANIVKCRPPRNRRPEDDEGTTCLAYVKRQIELVSPKVIVTLGAVPLHFLLGLKGINRYRGQWHEYNGIPVMPTFHPAFLLRAEERKADVWEDLKQVMVRLGKDPKDTRARRTTS